MAAVAGFRRWKLLGARAVAYALTVTGLPLRGFSRVHRHRLHDPHGFRGPPTHPGSHVIHFNRWWNPAVENQATDRAFRIGQKRNVMVHKFTCRGTLEERIHEVIASKSALAEDVLGEGGERLLTEMNNSELLRFVALDIKATSQD